MKDGIVAILRRGTRFLLIERAAGVPFPGTWAPPSGKVEPGEALEAAVVREVREEIGLVVDPIAKVWECDSVDGQFRLHWWEADIVGGVLDLDHREVANCRWIEPHEHARLKPIFDIDRSFFTGVAPALPARPDEFDRLRSHWSASRLVLFDFDYTLADSSVGVIECANTALRKLGNGEAPAQRIRETIGLSLTETYTRLTGDSDASRAALFRQGFTERADQVMTELTHVFPGVPELVDAISVSGRAAGIVSTKFRYRIQGILEREGLDRYFAIVIGGEDVARQKPAPDALLAACAKLDVSTDEAVYFGDHHVDARAARDAGIPMAAILTGTCVESDFSTTDPIAIVSNLSALREIIG